ncbi:MAG: transposase [Eubacteriales bacterium]|nr:transposase [Eubacteriales bacterium]
MSRQARIQSEYQHIIVRGIGKQLLFEDDEDRLYYISLLRRFCADTGLAIHAYCLMENHVHLLVRDTVGVSATFMKKLGISYAMYFNRKYERSGHLFQDRYKSEIISDDAYYLTVFRYILNNPEKAGICAAESYRWSSYSEYGCFGGVTDTSMICKMIGETSAFKAFLKRSEDTECMEADAHKHDDKWALRIIHEELQLKSATEVQGMSREQRDEYLVRMRNRGMTVRQIERLTGINRGVIQKAQKSEFVKNNCYS